MLGVKIEHVIEASAAFALPVAVFDADATGQLEISFVHDERFLKQDLETFAQKISVELLLGRREFRWDRCTHHLAVHHFVEFADAVERCERPVCVAKLDRLKVQTLCFE